MASSNIPSAGDPVNDQTTTLNGKTDAPASSRRFPASSVASKQDGHDATQSSTTASGSPDGLPSSKAQSGKMEDSLDLADGGANKPADLAARIEKKRLEHEKQKALQKKAFEDKMKALEEQHEREEKALMSSRPTSPATDDKATRRHSAEGADAATAALNKLSLAEGSNAATAAALAKAKGVPIRSGTAPGDAPLLQGFVFDDDLDSDLQNSAYGGKYLALNTDDDKFPILVRRDSYPGILSASSAALDLAPLSQTPPRAGVRPGAENAPRGSEWPQFANGQVAADGRQRGQTHNAAASAALENVKAAAVTERASPLPRTLPAPRSALGGATAPTPTEASQPGKSSSPEQTRKINGATPAQQGAYNADGLSTLGGNGFMSRPFGGLDSSSMSGPFGQYGGLDSLNGSGVFAYDGAAGAGYGNNALFGMKPKRDVETNRFAGLRLEDLQGDMPALCKDQHGCRFLQRKLEEGNPEYRDMIFSEIFPHFAELMTDAFGNYLSQKLFEFATDEQRDALIDSISGELVSISLNMHGTRAVQKLLDFLTTRRQVQSLIMALNLNVVTLIKDLNSNHVIQKCLNHLPPEDNQFIYNAVATNCIEVATHRHGCCVLQRCIDHASESQRIQLVTEITYNSLILVGDPFGNYVVQYVLDLNDNRFIEAIVRQFVGNVCTLSAQKFSSNVVEKCIRVADAAGRKVLVNEFLNRNNLERMLRDSFANYVVQTALDWAEPAQKQELVRMITPLMPSIRNTPYGKRISAKISRDNDMSRGSGFHPGMMQGHFYMGPQPGHHFNGNHHGMPNDAFGARSPYPHHPGLAAHMGGSHGSPALGGLYGPYGPAGGVAMDYGAPSNGFGFM
ncbi:uncharacterized protein L969DRAFT_546634 [Mixia osmundae IAM 14324]|uniref:PUM-HD domain-containing protein n=1 Tax=Mixia osmundae (strain CBS 9802 / IAM 14324 / JCM 22182 / KY 12970) TaxID=764103 RepID=G7E807_MIXOS|nr:uncharacterized protein L969DRAFT_546634 [Mixia osmundae IAM 14324]KEI38566.1 hypothetical protein L969DRAFT_546634 [Mixia osmundae IAM 14324]GAA98967.1 hypothetical protein E5Q_05655 [Mixia osmundae IAM 14324]